MLEEIKNIYALRKNAIIERLQEFEQLWLRGDEEEIFGELAFCLLTPQSKAKICWNAILKLKETDLLLKGNFDRVEKELYGVRFKERKALYIVGARIFFPLKPLIKQQSDNIYKCREWLVNNIKGIGYKEAGHFLRNIGLGENLTILDRHILKNLNLLNVIEEIPNSLTKAKYMQIEKSMKDFALQIDIPVLHLDMVFWSKETGEIFK